MACCYLALQARARACPWHVRRLADHIRRHCAPRAFTRCEGYYSVRAGRTPRPSMLHQKQRQAKLVFACMGSMRAWAATPTKACACTAWRLASLRRRRRRNVSNQWTCLNICIVMHGQFASSGQLWHVLNMLHQWELQSMLFGHHPPVPLHPQGVGAAFWRAWACLGRHA